MIPTHPAMLKIDQTAIDRMEQSYPGIADQIRHFEAAGLPPCPNCGSTETASVQCGLIQRSINIFAATTKFHLVANLPKGAHFFCNACKQYFADIPSQEI